jgi:ribosomal protein S18 acetylase RimI-like enzyme
MVREATIEDWGEIWPFFKRVIAAGDTYCLPTVMMGGDARNRWFGGPRTTVLVAVETTGKPRRANPTGPALGAVVGTASIHPNQQAAGDHIANASFMIDPDHAGRGFGRELGITALARARREGYRGMQFNAVVETNTAAVKLWTSLGFSIIGTIPGAFRHPRDGYVGMYVMYRALR